jgi:hypothetical protein
MTTTELIRQLKQFPSDAPIWVVDLRPDGEHKTTLTIVNVYMDHVVGRATLMVEPL